MPRTPRSAAIVIAVALAAGCSTLHGPRPTAEERGTQVESFDFVWRTVRDKHWDPTLGGLDWEGVREELRPRVERAGSPAEARAVMAEMLSRLGLTHYAILPAEVYGDLGGAGSPGAELRGIAGLTVRVVDRRALVVNVRPGLPAAGLGIRPGWEVLAVDGRGVAPLLARATEEYRDSTLEECAVAAVVEGLLDRPPGRSTKVEFRDGADRKVRLAVPSAAPPGDPVRLGFLPPMRLDFDARRLDGAVGYIRFSAFIDPPRLMPAFEEAVRTFADAPGLILDLRGNPGGLGAMAMGLGGWFVDRPDQYLGVMTTRDARLRFVLNPRAEPYLGPLAILVDGCSMSTSEILAGGLQDLGRARVFGTRTGGAALPSAIERLPNGDGFQYALANYVSFDDQPLEGRGVAPDVRVSPDRPSLLAGRDPVIEAAVNWILSSRGGA